MLQEMVVTSDTAANSSHARHDAKPARTAALAVTVIAAATLAGAWFFQLVLDIRPCPLCLEQRYAYYLAMPLGVLTALAAARGAPRAVLYAGLVILAFETWPPKPHSSHISHDIVRIVKRRRGHESRASRFDPRDV